MIAAIGDVHGCSYELDLLIDKVIKRFDGKPGKIVMLGDYIDRGENSLGVLETIRYWDHPTIEMIKIRGNHDEMMIKTLLHNDQAMKECWLSFDSGGKTTIDSLGDQLVEYAEWMEKNLLPYYKTEKLLFSHAGMRPGIPLEAQTSWDLAWIGRDFLNNMDNHGFIVVHGHTTVEKPVIRENRIGLDTGCVYGNKLTAAIFNDAEELIGFETVSAM